MRAGGFRASTAGGSGGAGGAGAAKVGWHDDIVARRSATCASAGENFADCAL